MRISNLASFPLTTRHFGPFARGLRVQRLVHLGTIGVLLLGQSDSGSANSSANSMINGYWPATSTEHWQCTRCPEVHSRTAEIHTGVAYRSGVSHRALRETGVDQEGAFVHLGGNAHIQQDNGRYLTLDAAHWGTDRRNLQVRGGQWGHYRLSLDSQPIPGGIAEPIHTVFTPSPAGELTVPEGWVRSNDTGTMISLESALREQGVPLRQDRMAVRADFYRNPSWDYSVEYQRIQEDGFRILGGSFLTYASLLPVPLDSTTHSVDAHIRYHFRNGHGTLGYHGSHFNNNREAIFWANPFSFGPEQGFLATEPDNRFQQLSLSGQWNPHSRVGTHGRLTLGRMEQDALFLSSPFLNDTASLPRSSLEGEVITLTARARGQFRATPRLTLTADAWYSEKDNRTPRAAFEQPGIDGLPGTIRSNRPHSHQQQGSHVLGEFRLLPSTRISSGWQREWIERDLQAVEQTEINTGWGEIRIVSGADATLRLRYLREQQTPLDAYSVPQDADWVEHPLLRQYPLTERHREQLRAHVSFPAGKSTRIGFTAEQARDDYPATGLGLRKARDTAYLIDLTTQTGNKGTLTLFAGQQVIAADLLGDYWRAQQRDRLQTLGLTIELQDVVIEKLGLGIELTHTRSRARTLLPDALLPLPDVRTDTDGIRMFARYHMSDRLAVRLDYWLEHTVARDFTLDAVTPDTIPQVLTLGRESPHSTVQTLGIRLIYRI